MTGRPFETFPDFSLVGTLATPVAGTIRAALIASIYQPSFFRIDLTLNKYRIAVTDGAGSGSYGAQKLFDFVEGGLLILGSRQDYTAFAEGSALTGGAGDAAFLMAVGSAAVAAAADGALSSTSVDIAPATSTITLSGGTGAGTKFGSTAAAFDGTSSAKAAYLNWSGTAATIDANSTIDVTGTISIVGCLLGDD